MHKNRDHFYVILMFAVTSYTVHSKMRICYTIHTTRHITLKCSLWEKCIIIDMYLKCICIAMISTKDPCTIKDL